MPNKILNTAVLVVLATLVCSAGLSANTLVVGPATCGPKVKHYAAIQDAVNAAGPNDIVSVCPGTYAEQVVISQPLTVRGIVDGTSGAAVIVVPAGGLVPNVVMSVSGIVAAQIVAQNTFGVKLANLTIDGTGGPCATDVGANLTAGIALSNLQSSDPTFLNTTVQQTVVRSQRGGCGLSAGILAENSVLLVDSNSIHDVEANAVSFIGGTGKITNNTIENCTLAAVLLSNVSNATVSGNTMASDQYGVNLNATLNVNVWSNNMGPWVGMGVYATNESLSWINGNRVSATWAGIYLSGSLGDRVTSNTIVRTQAYGIVDTASRGGNQVSGNTINEGPVGIYDANATAAGDVLIPNVFLNVTTTTTSNPF